MKGANNNWHIYCGILWHESKTQAFIFVSVNTLENQRAPTFIRCQSACIRIAIKSHSKQSLLTQLLSQAQLTEVTGFSAEYRSPSEGLVGTHSAGAFYSPLPLVLSACLS